MINLFKMELYRLGKSWGFWILLAGSAAFGLFMCFSEMGSQSVKAALATGQGGGIVIAQMIVESFVVGSIASIYGVIHLGQSFRERTACLAVEAGCGRGTIFMSKAAAYFTVTLAVMAAYVLAGAGVLLLSAGAGGHSLAGLDPLFGSALICILTSLAVYSAALLFLAIFRDSAKTTLFSILSLMAHIFMASAGILPGWLLWMMPVNQLVSAMPLGMGSAGWLTAAGIDLAFLAVFTGLGCLIFSKRELK